MIKYLRKVVLALSVACIPPEEFPEDEEPPTGEQEEGCGDSGSESACTGNELFCDDFDGTALDLNRWGPSNHDMQVYQGALEMMVTKHQGRPLYTNSGYELGNDRLVFEAGWKMREGITNCGIGFYRDREKRGAYEHMFSVEPLNGNSDNILCTFRNGEERYDCATNTRQGFTVGEIRFTREQVTMYINNEQVGSPESGWDKYGSTESYIIGAFCQAFGDKNGKACFDYFKLSRE